MTAAQLDNVNASRAAESRIGWLTTIRPDGSPHTTPVWFVVNGAAISVASAVSNVKVGNIRFDTRVSMAIDGSADSPLVAQGNAELVAISTASPAMAEAFSRKYHGWDIQDDIIDGERILIEIHVTRWLLGR